MQSTSAEDGPRAPSFLPGFQPLCWLWDGDDALFPSQSAARWFVHRHRAQLEQDAALAKHRHQLYVHVDKVYAAVREAAFRASRRDAARSA